MMLDQSTGAIEARAVRWGTDLREEIARRLHADGEDGPVEVPLAGPVDALRVLRVWSHHEVLFFWGSRGHREIALAAGVSDEVSADVLDDAASLEQMVVQVEAKTRQGGRYYGGIRFDPSRPSDDEWASYKAFRFVRPRWEMRITAEGAVLHVNGGDLGSGELLADLARWRFDEQSEASRPILRRVRDLPERGEWISGVSQTLEAIRAGSLEKAVLARAVDLEAAQPVNAADIFQELMRMAPSCYHILFQPEPGNSFVCITPERLIRRTGDRLVSEAVAGTRPRSRSAEDDDRLRAELLASDKDRREHAVVGRSIVDGLAPHARRVDIEKNPSEMRLSTGRHLKSRIRADLNDDVSTGMLVSAIHPTPAVGGHPTDVARDWLRQIEPFDRGWYAGAIGWIGEGGAELAVGIRSALVQGSTVRLFSGAGIVEGSEPDAEWKEIEQKVEGFLHILQCTES